MEDKQLLEAQVLYAVIYNSKWADDLIQLEGKDFSFYQSVFEDLIKLKNEGRHFDLADVMSINQEVKDLINIVMSDENLGFSIIPTKKIFNDKVELLKEISLKKQISDSMYVDFDVDILKEKLDKLYKKGQGRWLTGEDIKNLAFEILKNKKESSILYHLDILDQVTQGIEPSQYIIIAGRPSIGKSAMLQYVGLKNAKNNKKVLFVSAEMSEEMIIKRILTTYQPDIIPTNFNILITSDISTIESEISKKARDFDLVLVDYLQLLKPKVKTRDLYERVTNISSEIKLMATKFNLPFICASQFSRKAEGNQPNLADLKESGALEQDADVVISLWRHKADDLLNIEELLNLRVDLLKNRNGRTFLNSDTKQYSIMFNRKRFTFNNIERRKDEI
jgi:replicative DNA helicase